MLKGGSEVHEGEEVERSSRRKKNPTKQPTLFSLYSTVHSKESLFSVILQILSRGRKVRKRSDSNRLSCFRARLTTPTPLRTTNESRRWTTMPGLDGRRDLGARDAWDPDSWAGTLTSRNKMREALRLAIEGDDANVVVRKERRRKRRQRSGPTEKGATRPSSRISTRPDVGRREYRPHRPIGGSVVTRPRRPGTAGPPSSRSSRTAFSEPRVEAHGVVRKRRPKTANMHPRARYQPGSLFLPVQSSGRDSTAPMCKSPTSFYSMFRTALTSSSQSSSEGPGESRDWHLSSQDASTKGPSPAEEWHQAL